MEDLGFPPEVSERGRGSTATTTPTSRKWRPGASPSPDLVDDQGKVFTRRSPSARPHGNRPAHQRRPARRHRQPRAPDGPRPPNRARRRGLGPSRAEPPPSSARRHHQVRSRRPDVQVLQDSHTPSRTSAAALEANATCRPRETGRGASTPVDGAAVPSSTTAQRQPDPRGTTAERCTRGRREQRPAEPIEAQNGPRPIHRQPRWRSPPPPAAPTPPTSPSSRAEHAAEAPPPPHHIAAAAAERGPHRVHRELAPRRP